MAITATPTGRTSRQRTADRGGAPAGRVAPARLIVALLIGVALALIVTRLLLAEAALDDGRYDAAVALAPGWSDPRTAQATRALDAKRPARAESEARAALARDPLAVEAIRALAEARAARDDAAGQARLYGAAARLGWRDLPSQLWLADALLRAGNYPIAMQRLDGFAIQDQNPARLAGIFDPIARDPDMRASLVATLTHRPAWRTNYLRHLPDEQGLPGRLAVLQALAESPAPPNRQELVPLVHLLLLQGRGTAARAVWAFGAEGRATAGHLVFDAGFEQPPVQTEELVAFDWDLRASADGLAERDAAPGGGGQALHAHADSGAGGVLARQTVLLAPGPHVVTVAARGGAASLDALRWSIDCAVRDGSVETAPIAAGAGHVGVAAQVAADCPIQQLALHAAPSRDGQPSDAWFDDVRIDGR